jgi:hypothetical protein
MGEGFRRKKGGGQIGQTARDREERIEAIQTDGQSGQRESREERREAIQTDGQSGQRE